MPKLDQKEFDELMGRVRSGDQQAAAELVSIYEPEIRRDVRVRLVDSHLRRTLDSTDICQSIFGNFFVRVTLGQYEFERPEALLGLLVQMAKNKLIDKQRFETARQPRGKDERVVGKDVSDLNPLGPSDSPSAVISAKDFQARIEKSLTDEELEVARMRRDGFGWNEIAEKLQQPPDTLRKRLSRAGDRLVQELELDD